MTHGDFRACGTRLRPAHLALVLVPLLFSAAGVVRAGSASGVEETRQTDMPQEGPFIGSLMRPLADPALDAAPVRIDATWRESQEVPSRFLDMADDPDRFFSLGSPPLRDLVQTALRQNPGLLEAEAAWRSALQKVRVVSAMPDPIVAVTAFVQSIETRVGPQQAALMLTQQVPWFGKLSAAGQAALEEALVQAWNWRRMQREIVLSVKTAFYELAYLAEALEITGEDLSTLRRYERIALTRYETGRGIQQNVLKVQSEITRLSERRMVLVRQQGTARKNMALLAGRPLQEIRVDRMNEPLRPLDIRDIPLETLYGKGNKNRDELQASLHALRATRQEVRLAEKQYWPDLNLGFNYVFFGEREDLPGRLNPPADNGRDAFGFAAAVRLPIWYRKVGAAVDAARLEEIRARAAYVSRQDRVLFEVQDAYLNLESLGDQMDLYRSTLIPQAEQALRSSEASYETGKLSFLELLDSERFLLSVRYGYARIKADYLSALARMERALGVPFPGGAGETRAAEPSSTPATR